jgi:hypothetical protein
MSAETSTRPPGRATPDELEMIRDALLLPNMVIMLERQREEMEYSQHMLKPLYLKVVDALIAAVNRDLSQLRMELRRRKIKTWEGDQTDFVLYIPFTCRGYEDRLGIVREVAKAEIQIKLTRYINDVFKPLLQ